MVTDVRSESVSSPSQLIQPLICTQAISTLKTVVPGSTPNRRTEVGTEAATRFQTQGFLRYRQVFLTSVPLVLGDFAALVLCYMLGTLASNWFLGESIFYPGLWNNMTALCLCHFMLGSFLGLFPASGINPVCELRNQITSISGSFLVLVALNGLVGEVTTNEEITIGLAFPLILIAGPCLRFAARRAFARARWWGEKVIIVGNGRQGKLVYEFLDKMPQRGLKPVGMVDDNPGEYWISDEAVPIEFLGNTSELVEICYRKRCHWVIAAVSDKSEAAIREILSQGSLIPNLVVLSTNMQTPSLWVESFDVAGLTGIHIKDRLLCPFQKAVKRASDVVLSAGILLACSPLLMAIALWIKLKSPGPIFFKHHGRIGRNGARFGAYKIRTMVVNAESRLQEYLQSNPEALAEWKRDLKLKDDPRVIPGIGNFLRRTSLDELPQLLNVLNGEMSLVGPRPIYTDIEVEKFQEHYPLYLRVRPGLTGLWQVSGRNNTSYEDRVRLDCYYVRNWSLWLDYFILLRTIRTVLFREGSY
jgi:Undecaprenyl-phosphate galactose phosphotransferase WbaP